MNIQELIENLKNVLDNTQYTMLEVADKIYEMADPASEIKKNIRNLAPQIFEHLYKIIVYSKYPKYEKTAHHWSAEIRAALVKFCYTLVKGKNKPLNTQQIMDSLISKFVNSMEMLYIKYDCQAQYSDVDTENVDIDIIYEKIIKILPQLIDYIKSTKNPNVNKIEEIVKEYAL